MKRKMFIAVFSIISAVAIHTAAIAQQTPSQTTDREIEAVEKELLLLKQRKLEALRKQVEALKEELSALEPRQPVNSGAGASNPAIAVDTNPRPLPGASAGPLNVDSAAPAITGAFRTQAPRATIMENSSAREIRAAARTESQPALTENNQSGNKCFLVNAEPRKYSRFDVALCSMAREIIEARIFTNKPKRGITLVSESGRSFLPLLLFGQIVRASQSGTSELAKLILEIESSRTDKQLGADDKGAGSTSVAVRGAIPAVLSWAVENGAAVASSSGTTLTFRVNPVGLIEGLSGQGYLNGPINGREDGLTKFLRNTSAGFSFDTNRGAGPEASNTAGIPVFTGSKQQLSAVSFRYQLVNQRDPRHPQYIKLWDQFFNRQALSFGERQSAQLQKLIAADNKFRNENLQGWLEQTNIALGESTVSATEPNKQDAIDEARAIIERRLADLPVGELEKDPDVIDAINSFVDAYQPYLEGRREILDQVAKGSLVTFEYTNYREINAPDISNFRFIAEKATYGRVNLTANASISIYNKLPMMKTSMTPVSVATGTDVRRIRDFSFTGQIDAPLRDVLGLGSSNLSFAGKYQRLMSDAVALDGTILPNTKGDIAVGQIKLIIPIKNSGLKLPLSLTFASRTELVREKEVRGNFGLTFDLDTLFARFKPFK